MGEVHIKRDFSVPPAIQFKNPGAMWPGSIASKWGSTTWTYLKDGTGQGGGGKGNKIAIFDNWVDGICAQLDLWRTSPKYKDKQFADAIAIWSGGNHVESYIAYVLRRIPGMTRNTIMDDAFWQGPMGIAFLKAQSGHEAGRAIPAAEQDWLEAQRRVFSASPVIPLPTLKEGSIGVAVRTLQMLLGIRADAIFGKATKQAVMSMQAQTGLSVDGVVGPQTWKVLNQKGNA